MKTILFLHGWFSSGESKTNFLRFLGYHVLKPDLNNYLFFVARHQAQKIYDQTQPDLIVGSSRGAAIALNINSKQTPMILLSPPWRHFGKTSIISKPNTIVIHSLHDTLIPHEDSVILLKNSVKGVKLLSCGVDHQLNCRSARNGLENSINSLLGSEAITNRPSERQGQKVSFF